MSGCGQAQGWPLAGILGQTGGVSAAGRGTPCPPRSTLGRGWTPKIFPTFFWEGVLDPGYETRSLHTWLSPTLFDRRL